MSVLRYVGTEAREPALRSSIRKESNEDKKLLHMFIFGHWHYFILRSTGTWDKEMDMTTIRKNKWFSSLLIFFFSTFILDTSLAKDGHPTLVKINIKMDIGIKVKKSNKGITPTAMKISGRSYKVKQKKGLYGFDIKTRDLANLSPEFKDNLATSVSALSLYRIQQLVNKDKKKAEEVVKRYREVNRKANLNTNGGNKFARLVKNAVTVSASFFVGEAQAADASAAVVDKNFMRQMNGAYNQVLNSQSFAYPIVQPGIGGWDLLNENEQDDPENENEQDEEESWYDTVLDVLFAIVVIIAPIAAIVFLCSNPLTFASVLMSLAIANGAVTGAGIITSILGSVGDVLSGKPLLEITDTTQWGIGPNDRIDNSWSWP